MNLKKISRIVLTVFCVCGVYAQKYQLGKEKIEELKETKHPIDSSASAAVIFKTGETDFNLSNDGEWKIITEVNYKIKIFKVIGY